jgi:hypothetical protein
MANRTWTGGTGDWFDASWWATDPPDAPSDPLPGDLARVPAGKVRVPGDEAPGGTLDARTVLLGSADPARPAVLAAAGATVGRQFTIASTDADAFAALSATGPLG